VRRKRGIAGDGNAQTVPPARSLPARVLGPVLALASA
jgi:hypothetical protein